MYFSWSVPGYYCCWCFCWRLSFIIVRLNKDQVDSETRAHCRIGFLCRNLAREIIGLRLVFPWYNWYILILLFCIHLPVPFICLCGLKCQFYKAEVSHEWFSLIWMYLKGLLWHLKYICSYIRCLLCCDQNVSAFAPERHRNDFLTFIMENSAHLPANRLARSH